MRNVTLYFKHVISKCDFKHIYSFLVLNNNIKQILCMNLKKCFMKCVFSVSEEILEHLVAAGQLEEIEVDEVRNVLSKRHTHQYEQVINFYFIA